MRSIVWLIPFLVFVASIATHGQTSLSKPRTLSYQELLDEMVHCTDSIYLLDGATIQLDPSKDQRFLETDSAIIASYDTLRVQAEVRLTDIHFEGEGYSSFINTIFEQDLSIEDTGDGELILIFNEVQFRADVQIQTQRVTDKFGIAILGCEFEAGVNITSPASIFINQCTFRNEQSNALEKPITWTISMDGETATLRIHDSRFHQQHEEDAFQFIADNIYSLKLFDVYFETLFRVPEGTISDLTLHRNTFENQIDFTNIEFGFAKSEIEFPPMSKRISVYTSDSLWRPTTIEAFEDAVAAERFFAVYRKLIDFYKIRGNRKEYNLVYTEMKDYETLHLQYDYQQNPNLENWFTWKMNQFLATFSNYGTTPVKAILYAIRVILLFALLFFFFHNDWNTFTRGKFMSRTKLLSKYFRSEEGIAELYQEQHKPKYETYEAFIQYMRAGEKELPRFFMWLAKPMFYLSTLGMKTTNRFLHRLEFLNGKWVDQGKKKRRRTAFWTGFYLFGSLLISLLLRMLNAIMLSINAFTTLGFGEIPTKGIARYAAIVEGFIGWFLLTIFSVSLISQLLQ